ncbi:MAG: D-aminoacyl-tRNA deacylase [Bacteroidota bacterium]|nr:D-aminoacyl-tRNA deacylase [Bacteroidota bacterium]MDP4232398.1 D-aminoacyl-tRNA deacylase [Bacteroidota bacterium]MDP4241535.1 D-aminoacyl-tRNA deacylase [Bacteroidota bacterium]MDP4288269.1 D-aminoacyl-tRNA deacylase [Bacteroidota bacterium]
MRVIIQRVTRASVRVDGELIGSIADGLVALVGFRDSDTQAEIQWMARKLPGLRVFSDSEGKMNHSLRDINGQILIVSQFTVYGNARKGNRPSYILAARPEKAVTLYHEFIDLLRQDLGSEQVASGVFQAHMQLELMNDGPVTLILERDAKDTE